MPLVACPPVPRHLSTAGKPPVPPVHASQVTFGERDLRPAASALRGGQATCATRPRSAAFSQSRGGPSESRTTPGQNLRCLRGEGPTADSGFGKQYDIRPEGAAPNQPGAERSGAAAQRRPGLGSARNQALKGRHKSDGPGNGKKRRQSRRCSGATGSNSMSDTFEMNILVAPLQGCRIQSTRTRGGGTARRTRVASAPG